MENEQLQSYQQLVKGTAYEKTIGISLDKAVDMDESITLFHNDQYSNTQWYLDNSGRYVSYKYPVQRLLEAREDVDMDIYEAWDYQETLKREKKEVIVAIIDTGIDTRHEDLLHNLWINEGEIPGDGIDNDNNGYIDDVYGWDFYNNDATVGHYVATDSQSGYMANPKDNDNHGTHIAGIIGAKKDNGYGIAGIASNVNVKLMVLKINGGSKGNGSISNAIKAIEYATMMGADICNISWGTSQYSEGLKKAIDKSDMLFVAAAGNAGGNNNNKAVYPSSLRLPNLISVTYIDPYGEMTPISNYGTKTVDVAAPGEDIFSSVVGGYESMSGSSMAAAHVTGVAALLYASYPDIYPYAMKRIITDSVKNIESLNGKIRYPGIISAYQAFLLAEKRKKSDAIAPKIDLSTQHDNGKYRIKVESSDDGGSGIRVILWQSGKKKVEDFKRGTSGTPVTGNEVLLYKAGTYTFYISDFSGNETIRTHVIIEDTVPPTIYHSYKLIDKNKNREITLRVTDALSGVRKVKYMAGKKKAEDFLPAGKGTELTLVNNKVSFKVKKDGFYTVYATDNRGNITIRQIDVKTK